MKQSIEMIDIVLPLEDSEDESLCKKRAAIKLKLPLNAIHVIWQ